MEKTIVKPKVVNISKDPFDVYIGRRGHGHDGYFGNPATLEDGTRSEILAAYTEYLDKRLAEDAEFRQRVKDLNGQTLGCFCKPKRCHGDILASRCYTLNIEDSMFE